MEINWKLKKNDYILIKKIIERYKKELWDFPIPSKIQKEIEMDITAVHLNLYELDLEKMLKADKINFLRDILGIRKNIDRLTCSLKDSFVPKYIIKKIEK